MITLRINNLEVSVDKGLFSDGALRLKLLGVLPRYCESATISVRQNTDPQNLLFELASVVDVLRSINRRIDITLFMPYLPYARQDRCMVKYDTFSLKVFANMLNSLNIESVVIFDAHSDVGPALINNCMNIPQVRLLKTNPLHYSVTSGGDFVVVSPDAGALKKIHAVLGALPNSGLVVLDKERNAATGEILGMRIVDCSLSTLEGRRCIIFDDICDGGATFIGAAKALKDAGAETVELVVTHGIFSRGFEHLLSNGVDKIYTTDSICFWERPDVDDQRIRIFECEQLAQTLNLQGL